MKNSVEEAPEVESALDDGYPDSWKMPPKAPSRRSTFQSSWKPETDVSTATLDTQKAPGSQDYTKSQTHPLAEHPTAAPVQSTKSGSGTELHQALLISAEEGTCEAIQRIIKKGVDVNAYGGEHGHALCTAASNGRKDIVKLLIKEGALVNLPASKKDGFALHAAAAEGHVDVVKVLLNQGAEVKLQGGQFRFALTAGKHEPILSEYTVTLILNISGF